MPTVYAFANQKGGVGKTTSAVNIAAYLAMLDKRVLLIDIDPQANATSSLGVNPAEAEYSIYDALLGAVPLEQAILLTKRLHLDIVPSSPELAGAEVELVGAPNREFLLSGLVKPLTEKYDYILVDSPPSLGLLTLNALVASDGVIIPIQCEYLALEGLSQLLNTVHLVQERLNPRLKVSGIAMVMFDSRTHLSMGVVEQVAKHFPDLIFHSVVPRSVRIAEAPSYGEPLVSFDPKSRGAQAYEALTNELLERENTNGTSDNRGDG